GARAGLRLGAGRRPAGPVRGRGLQDAPAAEHRHRPPPPRGGPRALLRSAAPAAARRHALPPNLRPGVTSSTRCAILAGVSSAGGVVVKARVYVTLKRGVLDPQGKAVCTSLHQLGYREVTDVRVGKYME